MRRERRLIEHYGRLVMSDRATAAMEAATAPTAVTATPTRVPPATAAPAAVPAAAAAPPAAPAPAKAHRDPDGPISAVPIGIIVGIVIGVIRIGIAIAVARISPIPPVSPIILCCSRPRHRSQGK